jgi:hypothetical protein
MDEFASREMREMRWLPARLARLARDFAIIFVRESFFAAAAAGIATRASGVAAIVILTTTATAIAAATAATWAARTAAAGFFRPGFVDFEVAAADVFAVERGDGFGCLGIVGHFDETEAAGTAGFAIGGDVHAGELAEGLEQRAEVVCRSLKAHIADKEIFHGVSPPSKAQPSHRHNTSANPRVKLHSCRERKKERAVPGRQNTLREARKDCKNSKSGRLILT